MISSDFGNVYSNYMPGYGLNISRARPSKTKKFTLGNATVRIYNYGNKALEIDNVQFDMNPDGSEFRVYFTNRKKLNSLQELVETVNQYKRAYKIMLEAKKKLSMLEDF
jgi:hypothetical protein